MKKMFLLCLLSFSSMDSLVQAYDGESTSFCQECGTIVTVDLVLMYKSKGEGARLLCKKCSKRGKNGRKDALVSSSFPSSSSLTCVGSDTVFDSPMSSVSLSPVSPLLAASPAVSRSVSMPVTFLVDEKKAIELAEFIVKQRLKKGVGSGENFLISYGEPATSDEALTLKARLFETLFEASKMPEDERYSYTLHEIKKYAEVVDPHGNEHLFTINGNMPLLWKRGGFSVLRSTGCLEVRDLIKNRSYSFPVDAVSLGLLKEKCQDYGFEKVVPLTSYEEADLMYQAALGRLASPKFAS